VVGGRVVDGARLHGAASPIRARRLPDLLKEAPSDGVADEDEPEKTAACTHRVAHLVCEPFCPSRRRATSWVAERIEYEFAVAAR